MATLATLVVSLLGDISPFLKSMEKAEHESKGIGGRISGAIGGGLETVGHVATIAAGATVAAVGAIGTAAFASAMKLDDAYDTIQIGTGATGEALEALKQDFRTVFTSVPADAGAAASAVTILNERLGATGPFLTDLAKPLLEASRLMGGDAAENAKLFSRVMGDWSIPLEDASTSLDAIFVASQKTAVPMDRLMDSVVKFGSPLRLMGFSFKESAALIAKFEKEGVNTELVLGALRIASGKFARDNIPLQKGLQDSITKIRDMKDSSAALALGMKIFGAKAGPDMTAAIREGRFAVDDLVEAMQNADGAILETAKATEDFPEKFQRIKNAAEVALAPLGMIIMDGLGAAFEAIGPIVAEVVPQIVNAFTMIIDWLQTNVGPVVEQLAPQIIGTLQQVGAWIQTNVAPIFNTIVTAVQGVIAWVVENWPKIQQSIVSGIQNAYNGAKPIFEAIWSVVSTVFGLIRDFIDKHGAEITAFVTKAWNAIREIISGVVTVIQTVVTAVWGAIAQYVQENQEAIRLIIDAVWNTIRIVVETVLNVIRGIVNAVLALLRGDVQGALDAIKGIFVNIWNSIKDTVQQAIETVQQILLIAWAAIKTGVETAWNNIKTTIENLWEGIMDFFRSLPERLVQIGKDMIEGLLRGLREAAHRIGEFLSNLVQDAIDNIKHQLGIASPSAVMAGIGEQMMAGLAAGIEHAAGLPQAALDRISTDMAANFGGEGGPAGQAAQDNRQFVLNVYEAGRATDVAHDFALMQMLAV